MKFALTIKQQSARGTEPGAPYSQLRYVLVLALRSRPVDDVNQLPGVLVQLKRQLALGIQHQLRCRIQDTAALALVLLVDIYLACRQVVTHGRRVGPGLSEA